MKITKQIESFNLDHDIVIAVENKKEVDILIRMLKELKFKFNFSTPESIARSLNNQIDVSVSGFRLSSGKINRIKYYIQEIGESAIHGSCIEIVYLKDYTNNLENLKEKINNYIKNKEL